MLKQIMYWVFSPVNGTKSYNLKWALGWKGAKISMFRISSIW